MNNNTSILLVDDHPLFRKGVRDIIDIKHGFTVVGEAGTGTSAITQAVYHNPDLIIMDLALPDINGLEVISKISKSRLNSAVIIMTLYNDAALIEEAAALGVVGYLMKSDGVEVLNDCLDRRATGEMYLSPGVGDKQPDIPRVDMDADAWLELLTARELTVLECIANNQTSREIALKLGLSVRTVQNHRARIIRKLALQGNNALYRFALDHSSEITNRS